MSKSPEPRCDIHGPYTAIEAALMVMDKLCPAPSGYRCPECTQMIQQAARNLADVIDRRAAEEVYRELYGS